MTWRSAYVWTCESDAIRTCGTRGLYLRCCCATSAIWSAEVRRLEAAGCVGVSSGRDGRPVRPEFDLWPAGGRRDAATDRPGPGRASHGGPPGAVSARISGGGGRLLTVHIEAVRRPAGDLGPDPALGTGAGLAMNPATPLAGVEPLPRCLRYGAGDERSARVSAVSNSTRRPSTESAGSREVGGTGCAIGNAINAATIRDCAARAPSSLWWDSAIFRSRDYVAARAELTDY